ncbi:MAG: transcriptional repressor LexA [Desulfobulbaceae bacterium]|nr:transcriptional repressor LexA [Desulfobulbaceae bacterium]
MDDLTPRQRDVFDYIIVYREQNGIAPTIREICRYLGLSSPGGIHRILRVLVDKGYIEAEPGAMRNWRPVERSSMERTLPLIGRIAAGVPFEAVENRDEELLINPVEFGDEKCFGIKVQDDSMVDVHILEGDVVVIKPCATVKSGTIAAVLVENMVTEATLKIFHLKKNIIELRAANPNYLPLSFKGIDRARVTVVGRLVGVVRRLQG